jgi:NTP pyrophosphatase (non-canonical NTP hydrolase)
MTLNELRDEIHATAREKGWYNDGERNIPEALALIHAEVSEALEEYREIGHDYYELAKIGFSDDRNVKPIGFAVEVADILIRCLDLAGYLNINIDHIIRVKMDYNKTRPYRHGGKKA